MNNKAPKPAEAWLTIVTSRVYTQERFIREAVRLGANRAVPSSILRNMEWHESILVGDWISPRGRRIVKAGTKETIAPLGTITAFGFFTVDNIIPEGWMPEAHDEFVKSLDIAGELDSTLTAVTRACGSYTLAGGYVVRDSIAQIVEKAEGIAKNHGLKLKWFCGGRFQEIAAIEVRGREKWTLGFRKVQLEAPISPTDVQQNLRFIAKYEQRTYIPKKERGNGILEDYPAEGGISS